MNYLGINDIAVFIAVVENGSFTAAARYLNTTKSLTSKYVTRLEDHLGAKLFLRTTRKMKLTEAGKLYYENVRKGFNELAQAEEAVSFLHDKPRGKLRVNCPLSFGVTHIAPLMGAFLERYPEVLLDLTFDDKKLDIVDEGYDVTIRVSKTLDGRFVARAIAPCNHAIVASSGYLKAFGTPKEPSDLLNHRCIAYQYQEDFAEWFFKHNGSINEKIKIDAYMTSNNSMAIREAALNGVGIAKIPTFLIGDDIRCEKLIHLFSDYRFDPYTINILYSDRKHLAPKVRAFTEFLLERIGSTPPWDKGLFC